MSAMGLLIVTLICTALACVMAAIAWRVARDERARGTARIDALAAAIRAGDLPLRPVDARTPAAARSVFTSAVPVRSAASRFGTVAAVGVFAFSCLAALAVWLMPGTPTAPAAPVAAEQPAAPTPPADRPLELIALGHERSADRLTVRGIVRNPASGGEVGDLAAMVSVFGRDDGLIVSARAPLASAALNPGAESAFLVTIPHAAEVSRYRVSFHRREQLVPHIDRRGDRTLARAQ